MQLHPEITKREQLPKYFISSAEIDPIDRVRTQGIIQKHIDTAISSTVNLKNSATIAECMNIYLEAWKQGLKGITIFRDGCKRLGILTTNSTAKTKTSKFNTISPVSRKELGTTHGDTYCKKVACGTLYITVNKDNEGNIVEVFIHTSKGGICQANINALARMISLSLRSGVTVEEVIDQNKGIICPACSRLIARGEDLSGIGCADVIAKTIQEVYQGNQEEVSYQEEKCPECGKNIVNVQGCKTCLNCGWSKCE